MVDPGGAHAGEPRLDPDDVVVPGGLAEACLGLHHYDEGPFVLEVPVAQARGAEHLGAGHLEEDEVSTVVEEAHAVDFGVTDADVD